MRLHEFFEDDVNHMSMSRLTLLGCFTIASIVMLGLTWFKMMNEGYFTIYLGTFAGVYGYSKKLDNPAPASTQPIINNSPGAMNVQTDPK